MSSPGPEDATLPPIEDAPAAHLAGRRLGNGWIIGDRIARDPAATGGFFSVAYEARNDDGQTAFLKALNFDAASIGPGLLVDRLHAFTSAYRFERDLLAECCTRRMSRIITLLDHGQVSVPEARIPEVPYLIFEMADGDIRAFQALGAFDCAWAFRVMQHTLVGIGQLHQAHAAHQDLKPSNVLTQANGTEMKLGDLGRADRRGLETPWSDLIIPGDTTYAPPEQQYGAFTRSWEERKAGDMYLAGSLGAQLFLGHCVSAILQARVVEPCRVRFWTGTYEEVLPFLVDAHSAVVDDLSRNVQERTGDAETSLLFSTAIAQMTHTNPLERGHPKDRAARTSSYSLQRYVSLMNRLAARARRIFLEQE
jgi:Protein kinase domain.